MKNLTQVLDSRIRERNAKVSVMRCGPQDAEAWDRFVASQPGASHYHRYGWKEVNEDSFGHECFYLAAVDASAIRGVLPLVLIESCLFGRILCSLPFVNYGGAIAEDEASVRTLIAEASRLMSELRADYVELRAMKPAPGQFPTATHKISLTVDLYPDPDCIWKAYTTKHRNEVRRAYKNGLSVVFGRAELLDPFYEILSESWKRRGTPLYSKNFFANILEQFGESVCIFLVLHEGRPISAAANVYFRGTVEGLWLGTRDGCQHLGASYVLYWEMIKDGCLKQQSTFHLGRSTVQSGGEQFKRKWNVRTSQLYWQYILRPGGEIPRLNVENPKYKLAMKAWRHLPATVTNILGPSIARAIP